MAMISRKHVVRIATTALLIATASLPAWAIKPFTADYDANYMGMLGKGQMKLVAGEGNRGTVTLNIRSNVANLTQSTEFEDHNGKWRPLSSKDSSLLLIKKVNRNASYDWDKGEARWTGDIKPDRAGPVKLKPGDLDGMLINLAIARDVAAGKPLHYRMVDDGRIKQLDYKIAGKETLTVDGKAQSATKVVFTDGNKENIVWVVDGLPVPARILQRRDGKDEMDLTLTSLR
ncbi:uncharacterized protein DUF3108 [Luteimonas cucumeris]|uniref:Uncharacterized protein DUF3108 n=1 Tax=Luteimonas cucumeris TaxID=985012 RepID=A0A562KY82_9GAMM|nr:DUF3108 domain-containing protein [Luteimonas cucumeris]TWI00317.1 uncharacterized protein DUF3108 [Luteimonas cucumeris]